MHPRTRSSAERAICVTDAVGPLRLAQDHGDERGEAPVRIERRRRRRHPLHREPHREHILPRLGDPGTSLDGVNSIAGEGCRRPSSPPDRAGGPCSSLERVTARTSVTADTRDGTRRLDDQAIPHRKTSRTAARSGRSFSRTGTSTRTGSLTRRGAEADGSATRAAARRGGDDHPARARHGACRAVVGYAAPESRGGGPEPRRPRPVDAATAPVIRLRSCPPPRSRRSTSSSRAGDRCRFSRPSVSTSSRRGSRRSTSGRPRTRPSSGPAELRSPGDRARASGCPTWSTTSPTFAREAVASDQLQPVLQELGERIEEALARPHGDPGRSVS